MSGILLLTFPKINWNHPLTRGLDFATPFFERGGINPLDLAGRKAVATSGTPIYKTGQYGPDMNFVSASSQYVDTKYGVALGANDSLSISFLAKTPSTVGTGQKVFIGAFDNGGNFPEFMCGIGTTNAGNPSFYISGSSSGNSQATTSGFDVRDDKWHVYTYVRSGKAATIKIYVDGIEKATASDSTSGGITITNKLFIARENGGTTYLDMDANNFLIHKRPLSPQEIKQHHANPFEIYRQSKLFASSILDPMTWQLATGRPIFETLGISTY